MHTRPTCDCFNQSDEPPVSEVHFHPERQDTTCAAWMHLLALIEQAAEDQRTEFAPMRDLTGEERRHIVTLPPTIAKLTAVRHLVLYGSFLVRIPPEIGSMTNLTTFTPYTSHRLHWFPYEITRCTQLRESTVSTRSLYGNFKFRPPFPKLTSGRIRMEDDQVTPERWGADIITTCSICERRLAETGVYQAWISLRVATDVVPLLVNACSEACLQQLHSPPAEYIPMPHTGGRDIQQPPARYHF